MNGTLTEYQRLASAVWQMRQLQNRYFKDRDRVTLQACKQQEMLVDSLCAPLVQEDFFDLIREDASLEDEQKAFWIDQEPDIYAGTYREE